MTRLFEAKPFVIAEVGSNWQTLEHCLESIAVAKACGADAVKFQAFNFQALYGPVSGRWNQSLELPLKWLPYLKGKADAEGIEFMCTAFSPELVAAVDPFVSVHKVASSDLSYPQLLQAVKKCAKPTLLSFGAATMEEVKLFGSDWLGIMLYCVAAYPADFVDLDYVGPQVGFSDHTLGITAAVEAARRGAPVIEKHFTAFPELDTPDRPHSVTPEVFKRMVDLIRSDSKPQLGPTVEEKAMLLRHKRRLIATGDIPPGGILRYGENFGAYRSLKDDTRGLSPFAWEEVEGKAAKVEIKRGDAIGAGDFG